MANPLQDILDRIRNVDPDIKLLGLQNLDSALDSSTFVAGHLELKLIEAILDSSTKGGVPEQTALECLTKMSALKLEVQTFTRIMTFYMDTWNKMDATSQQLAVRALGAFINAVNPVAAGHVLQTLIPCFRKNIQKDPNRKPDSITLLGHMCERFGNHLGKMQIDLVNELIKNLDDPSDRVKKVAVNALKQLSTHLNAEPMNILINSCLNTLKVNQNTHQTRIYLTVLANLIIRAQSKARESAPKVIPVFVQYTDMLQNGSEEEQLRALIIQATSVFVRVLPQSAIKGFMEQILKATVSSLMFDPVYEQPSESDLEDLEIDESIDAMDHVQTIAELPTVDTDDEEEVELEAPEEDDDDGANLNDHSWRVRDNALSVLKLFVDRETIPLSVIYQEIVPSLLQRILGEHSSETLQQVLLLIRSIVILTEEYAGSENDSVPQLIECLPKIIRFGCERLASSSVPTATAIYNLFNGLSFVIKKTNGLPLPLRITLLMKCTSHFVEEAPSATAELLKPFYDSVLSVVQMVTECHSPIQLQNVHAYLISFIRAVTQAGDKNFISGAYALIGKAAKAFAPHKPYCTEEDTAAYVREIYHHLSFSTFISELVELCTEAVSSPRTLSETKGAAIRSLGAILTYWSITDEIAESFEERTFLSSEQIIDLFRDIANCPELAYNTASAVSKVLSSKSIFVRLNFVPKIPADVIDKLAFNLSSNAINQQESASKASLHALVRLLSHPHCARSLTPPTLENLSAALMNIFSKLNTQPQKILQGLHIATLLLRAEKESGAKLGGADGILPIYHRTLENSIQSLFLSVNHALEFWESIARFYLAEIELGVSINERLSKLFDMILQDRIPDGCWKSVGSCIATLLLQLPEDQRKPYYDRALAIIDDVPPPTQATSLPFALSSAGAPPPLAIPQTKVGRRTPPPTAATRSPPVDGSLPLVHSPPPGTGGITPGAQAQEQAFSPLPHQCFGIFVFAGLGELCDICSQVPVLEPKLHDIITGKTVVSKDEESAFFVRTSAAQAFGSLAVGLPDKYAPELLKNASEPGALQTVWLFGVSEFLIKINATHDESYLEEGEAKAGGSLTQNVQETLTANITKFFGLLSSVLNSESTDVRDAAVLSLSRLAATQPAAIIPRIVAILKNPKATDNVLSGLLTAVHLSLGVTLSSRAAPGETQSPQQKFTALFTQHVPTFFALVKHSNIDVRKEACFVVRTCLLTHPSVCRVNVRPFVPALLKNTEFLPEYRHVTSIVRGQDVVVDEGLALRSAAIDTVHQLLIHMSSVFDYSETAQMAMNILTNDPDQDMKNRTLPIFATLVSQGHADDILPILPALAQYMRTVLDAQPKDRDDENVKRTLEDNRRFVLILSLQFGKDTKIAHDPTYLKTTGEYLKDPKWTDVLTILRQQFN